MVSRAREFSSGSATSRSFNKYQNLEEIHEALTRREVDGALIDTYVAQNDKSLFEVDHGIRVSKTLERTFGYGVALSGDAIRLVDEFRNYVMVNEGTILKIIEQNIESGPLKENGLYHQSSLMMLFWGLLW
ncbi:hypothetical protein QZH41_002665 [Actinostola sp. cb2023]|nr:hypothetical protein QZH41_002665 [Actinostola sp. cb2023]